MRKQEKKLNSTKLNFIFSTSYECPTNIHPNYRRNGIYGFFVVACNRTHAKRLLKIRNLQETLDYYEPIPYSVKRREKRLVLPSKQFKQGRIEEALHGAIFLLYIAAASGKINPIEYLKDTGAIHELVHINQFKDTVEDYKLKYFRKYLYDELVRLESNVIGIFPDK